MLVLCSAKLFPFSILKLYFKHFLNKQNLTGVWFRLGCVFYVLAQILLEYFEIYACYLGLLQHVSYCEGFINRDSTVYDRKFFFFFSKKSCILLHCIMHNEKQIFQMYKSVFPLETSMNTMNILCTGSHKSIQTL